jgi:hypothetical protein
MVRCEEHLILLEIRDLRLYRQKSLIPGFVASIWGRAGAQLDAGTEILVSLFGMRKIIQITTLPGPTIKLLALCNDGSIWQLAPSESTHWERIRAEIPND